MRRIANECKEKEKSYCRMCGTNGDMGHGAVTVESIIMTCTESNVEVRRNESSQDSLKRTYEVAESSSRTGLSHRADLFLKGTN